LQSGKSKDPFQCDHDLTLIIPAYNEEQRLPRTLTEAKSFLDCWGINYRVMVVDDGSQDATSGLAELFGRRFLTLSQQNGGKGSAVRAGMMAATGRVVAFTDADLPYDLNALKYAFDMIERDETDLVFGSRTEQGTTFKVERRLVRTIASAVFRSLMSLLVSRQVSDTQCGLKVFSRTAARKIFSNAKTNGVAFDAEVVYLAHLYELAIETIPVILVNDYAATISLSRNAIPMLMDVLRVRWRAFLGAYAATTQAAISQPAENQISRADDLTGRKAA
jgi:dolichyl-phosphate beta-glucosyltransferase